MQLRLILIYLIGLFFRHSASFFNEPILQNADDSCFCELKGAIDDCSCSIDTVDSFNNFKIYPRLKSLLNEDYFRYFQVDLKKDCPYWSDDGTCAMESCQVSTCNESEIPPGLKGDKGSLNRSNQPLTISKSVSDCNEDDLGHINTTISLDSQEKFERWEAHDNSLIDFCTLRDEADSDLQYVDLHLNPERYTGYGGKSAHRVWASIYNENCFKDKKVYASPFESQDDEMCIEKRTFFRAISGLHASINIHLSAMYLLDDGKSASLLKNSDLNWGPNITEFLRHFDTVESKGRNHTWLKNLYFLYLLELRALWKLTPFLQNYNLYTGNPVKDSDLKSAINDFLRVTAGFPQHFQEKALFSRKDALKLKSEFHVRFTNITRIMDCVGCQKCKLWGKLQIKGLGTALKVLFSEPNFKNESNFLHRNEIVALFNSFGKLSESINELDNFRRKIENLNDKVISPLGASSNVLGTPLSEFI